MKPPRLLLLVACAALAPVARAQTPDPAPLPPRLLIVFPCGAKAGTEVEVTVAGDAVDPADRLLFSDKRVTARRLETPAPDPKNPKKPPAGMAGPGVPATTAKFVVTVPADVPPGGLDVRVASKGGVSNPRCFWVGDVPEVTETEPNDDVDKAQELKLNSAAHGAIAGPTDVDYYSFRGKVGQRVVVSCLTSSVDSKLSAALQLFDPSGRQLAFNRGYRGDDALVDATLAEEGLYTVRVSQFTYTAGGADHFYRLAVSTAPWIDAVFPPAVLPGKPARVTVYGRNIPGGTPDPSAVVEGRVLDKLEVTVTPPPAPGGELDFPAPLPPNSSGIDGFAWTLRGPEGTSNPFLIGLASAPVVADTGDNDTAEKAQQLPVPCEVAGRIEKKRDRDWYAVTATKGSVWSVEAYADRIGSPLDLYLTITDPKGKVLVEADENTDAPVSNPFYCRTDDPQRFRFTAAEDGVYRVMVASRESFIQAGPRDLYRLRVTPERPDFRLVVQAGSAFSPDAPTVGRGGHQALAVTCWRQDGFMGPVELTVEGLPAGVTCPPQLLAIGQKQGVLVLTAKADAADWIGTVRVRGKAIIDGKPVVRQARPASVQWPLPQNSQNTPALARMDHELVLAVREEPPFRLTVPAVKLTANPGDKVDLAVQLEKLRSDFKGPLALGLFNAPGSMKLVGEAQQNNAPPGVPVPVDKKDHKVQVDVKQNFPPGVYTLVVRGSALIAPPAGAKNKSPTLLQLPSTPVTVVVLPKSLATVTVDQPELKVRPGQTAELKVKAVRQVEGVGPLSVEVALPANAGWLSVTKGELVPGQDELTLKFTATDSAPVGQQLKLVVRVAGTFDGTVIPTEAKLNVTVGSKK